MSFIHLSTVQPTDGQQELTDRQPAFIKNDFKNGIVLKKGETIELVSLRLAFNQVDVIEGENDTLYFQIGDAPNFCQLQAKLRPGSYDEESLGRELESSMNTAMNLPSFNVLSPLDPTTNIAFNSGIQVQYTKSNPTTNTPAKYSIAFQQLAVGDVGDVTFAERANTATDETLALYAPRSGLTDETIEGVKNGGNSTLPEDVWQRNILYANAPGWYNDLGYTTSLNVAYQHNYGYDQLQSSFGAQMVCQPHDATTQLNTSEQEVAFPQKMEGLIDQGGRVCVSTSPSQGFLSATLRGAVSGKDMTLTYNQQGFSVTGTVTLENGDATSNYWDFRFDLTAPQTIDANDGSGRGSITRLYGVFSNSTELAGVVVPGGLFWGVGGGADGTGGFPADARNPGGWTFNVINAGVSGDDTIEWFYDYHTSQQKGFKASCQVYNGDPFAGKFRIPYDTPGIEGTTGSSITPSFMYTDGTDMALTPDMVTGYPCVRVGINRAKREVSRTFQEVNENDPIKSNVGGIGGISTNTHNNLDYWIGIKNGTGSLDGTTGAEIPKIEVCVPRRYNDRPLYPDAGNMEGFIVVEANADTIIPGFDATLDTWFQVKVDNFNQITFSACQSASQDPRRANLTAQVAPANAAFHTIYQTTQDSANPITPDDLGDSQIKQSDYPLMAGVLVGRGSFYPPKNTVHQSSMDVLTTWHAVDGMLSIPDRDEFNSEEFQRQTVEPFPELSFAGPPDIVNGVYNSRAMFKFGRLTHLDVSPNNTGNVLAPDHYANKTVNKVRAEFVEQANVANVDRFLGYNNLRNDSKPKDVGHEASANTFDSVRAPRVHPFTDVFNVELLSEPVKSHNGARGDVGKAIYTVTAEELEVDDIERVVSFQPRNRLPVDLNIAQDKTAYSMTVAIKDINNRLLTGLRPPSDVTLFKSLPEGTKIERAVDKLKDVMTGNANDKNANEIANIGQHNPLLGVIPK